MKGFALGLALKQRQNATQKSPIETPKSAQGGGGRGRYFN